MARKTRIADAFAAQAQAYDSVANVQREVARRLAARIQARLPSPPRRILEIGCGTGLLSEALAAAFPNSALLLTDLAPAMLARCEARLGARAEYLVLDGEDPVQATGPFDLIASSLAIQWFTNLGCGLERLSHLLAPGGSLFFATLGRETFTEWRAAHAALGLPCGVPLYPAAQDFPWPNCVSHRMDEERIPEPHANGHAFVRSLKTLGAGQPAPDYAPHNPGNFRKLLQNFSSEFSVTYHILYGEAQNRAT
ncbi:MAG: hypothetical protein B7X08_04890 [Acidocella sp. 20-63-7]|nr:MAG: hypothetical protein B7X08_04890 [Acidocella sp. 20-63-7]HQT46935.1 methyltransferase domain-containing protein [Acidocella sp.]